jgi:ferric-dicitrate binding protein FerR (iron transport regulator)
MKGDYLWDRSGDPDLEVVRLERALGRLRHEEGDFRPHERARPRRARWLAAAAVPIAAAAAIVLMWRAQDGQREPENVSVGARSPGLSVVPLTGSPTVEQAALAAGSQFRPGQWLVTDATSRARIELGDIGEVRVGPDSRVRLVGSGPEQQRLELRRGSLHALVTAPPRLFLVDLPSATAVDLGCEYELTVDPSGAGVLAVRTGEVSLEGHGRASLVPAGSVCETRPGRGPGTPYREDAPGALVGALRRFDFEGGDAAALDTVLAAARARDTITLWHLAERAGAGDRGRVLARLAALAPPPPGVDIDDPASLDHAALEAWRAELEPSW